MQRAVGSPDPPTLFIVTGASGSGKSTIAGPLASRLRGCCVTFDVDCVLAAVKRLVGAGPIDWDAFREMWLTISAAASQSGLAPVLLAPFIPQHIDHLPTRSRIARIHYLCLDCPDDVRRARILARPFVQADLEQQVMFGQHLRTIIPERVDTGNESPDRTADTVASWVRAGLLEV